ncbi:MAG: hypothetical protein K0R67_3819 [Paenibacillus sp.]|nr:hypothetical protein [Paenibacillus sp.]
MMLPQHKEQLLHIQSGVPIVAEPPTKREIEVIRDSIILPVALTIVENKRLEIERSSQTLKGLYAATAHLLAHNIQEDVLKYRKFLVDSNIQVFEDSKDGTELHYRYMCRGREDRFVMTKDFMRAEISVRIGRYAKSLIGTLQQAGKST